MLRTLLCSVLAIVVFAGFSLAGDGAKKKKKKKNADGNSGEIVKIDAEKGLLTIKTSGRKKQPGQEKEFKVTDKTTVTEIKGEEKNGIEVKNVAELLKMDQFKAGTNVSVEPDEDGSTAKSITLGGEPQAKKKKKKKNQDK